LRAIACWLSGAAGLAHASVITPFDITNYNPLPQLYGLPLSSQATLLGDGEHEFKLLIDKTSMYAFADSANKHVLFDGESTHTTFIYNHALRQGLQLGIVIPYVSHEAGSLDNFIINWHNFFHLPQGGRDKAPRDQLHFYYERDGVTLLDITDASSGIGDVRLTAGWQAPDNGMTVNASLKLPTGDSQTLHGSGATDLALWLAGYSPRQFWRYPAGAFGSVGMLALGKGDVLTDQQKPMVLFGGVGAGIIFNDYVRFKAQLDLHTPFYYGDEMGHVNSFAEQCTMGGAIEFSKQLKLDIGVSEDFNVDASPDVNFHLGLQARF
jgi:hypothetical protein